MVMPSDLILVRHGESEGNVAARAARGGDLSAFTEEFVTTPGRQWPLTATGIEQAQATGAWLRAALPATATTFERAYVSTYVRACQTAGHLGLGLTWFKNRAIRERDWGDIGSMPTSVFEERYADNARQRDVDPLYWVPPGGESIAHVAENRVRNFLDTLHRETEGPVIAVTHGEFILATRLILERLDDEAFARIRADRSQLPGPEGPGLAAPCAPVGVVTRAASLSG